VTDGATREANEAADEDLGVKAATMPGGVRGVLNRSIERPGQEISSIISTFVVTLLDSPHSTDEWMAVYHRFAAQIWAEEFSQMTAQSQALSKVDASLNRVSHLNRQTEDGQTRAGAGAGAVA